MFYISLILLSFIALETSFNVFSRFLCNATWVGDHEFISLLSGLAVVYGLPTTMASRGHVTVTILLDYFPGLKRIAFPLASVIMAILSLAIFAGATFAAFELYNGHEKSMILGLPLYWLYVLSLPPLINNLWQSVKQTLSKN